MGAQIFQETQPPSKNLMPHTILWAHPCPFYTCTNLSLKTNFVTRIPQYMNHLLSVHKCQILQTPEAMLPNIQMRDTYAHQPTEDVRANALWYQSADQQTHILGKYFFFLIKKIKELYKGETHNTMSFQHRSVTHGKRVT
jgi:hypothetical protein